ncbi:chemotaxis response regulator protein-glutamate methylesterase [Teredinibacter sp. KSP-S5-2]|uniref:protein-glutamate methylesterase/protein-glutamine glutaminase n=1 Tax=Teredinibacter sp. KSP-S5-2 TaxID=3034506 RepID=UPI002934D17C|nr:chemotaxis response regulator protein-glutamate methylesterase [Teredinibacter sp. KSP-S5-2]WNO07889.1 chemotaxis response regulator protein-glutamate methylesterase [Teredinibacter sp. KSP-S5-2]
MPYKVLVVDDSSFFQMRLKEIISEHQDLQVVGIASNGQEAIELEEELRPDIITMDYEMPFMDGVSAVRAIMAKRKIPILMLSSMTYEGARITLEALDAGAVDFMPKNFAEVSKSSEGLKKRLHEKLLTFLKGSSFQPAATSVRPKPAVDTRPSLRSTPSAAPLSRGGADAAPVAPSKSSARFKGKLKIVVIGASTGGPVAITDIITKLPANFPVPIVIVQHMPENFTKAFSERLDRQSQLSVVEAENSMRIECGKVYVAPGGKQLMFDRNGSSIKIVPGDERVNYKPSVDIAYASAANVFRNSVLGIVLTGMGADGCEGARLLKQSGSYIWGQDQASSVVYGMPAAVANARLTDAVIPLSSIAEKMISDV